MTDIHMQTLSSLCDGEIVDPDALREALAEPQGREVLVDFARLRASVASTAPLPESLSSLRAPTQEVHRGLPSRALMVALLIVALLTAAVLPRLWTRHESDTPPTPARVVRYIPGVDWHPESR